MNTVDVESELASDQGDEKAFINTLLGEMKSQFNKAEPKVECSIKTEENMNDSSLNSSPVKEVQLGKVESDLSTNEIEYKESSSVDELPQSDDVPDEKDPDGKPRIVLMFKKPSDETSPSKTKDIVPGRRSLRNKHNSPEETMDESVPKRSSRRRSKDCSESILQTAIARKEKSYNEANKPQRLTRQLKPTPKILENLALAKQEKNKFKSPKAADKNNHFDSDSEVQNCENNGLPATPRKNKKSSIKQPKRNPKRLKISHNAESEKESDSDQSLSPDQESNLDIMKNARRSQRLSSRNKEECDEPSGPSPNIADQAKDFPDDPECSSVGAQLIASRLCLCTQKTKLFADSSDNDTIYCTAVDSIGEKLIGCTREVDFKETPLLRPSQRVPYLLLCDLHRNRLLRHNCCPTCGVFCTQGKFVECDAKHQYHKSCQISVGSMECCPHCGLSTPCHDIVITMHCSKKPVFLPVQKNYSSAKMSFPIIKENSVCSTPPLLPIETFQNSNKLETNDDEIFSESDLVEAVKDGDIDRLTSIIASDTVDLHLKILDFNNGNLLHYAAHEGLLPVCHLLVSASVELDEFDKEQNTPLMLAITSHKNDVVQYLVKAGASITIKGTDGMTALHIAAKCGNLSACQVLLQAAVTINNFVNSQDDGGWTPLVWACEHGYVDVANYLILKGADPCLRDVEHNEALHWAAFSGSSNIVELLLNRDCDVNTVNAHGESPLHIAAREDRYNCIIILLARGANVSLVNKNNETPLDCIPEGGESYNVITLNIQLQAVTGTDHKSYKTLLSNDISKGREVNPIQCVNAVDDEPEPNNYVYVTKNCRTSNINIDTKITSLHTCSCNERCVTEDCECTGLSVKCWYDEDGKLTPDFNFTDPPLIFECNEACSCNAITCRNRVVQKGLQQRFQLYKTDTKGWGVKTLRFIPKGSYVCEYVGEVLTDVLADEREDDSYLFDLDNRESESFCIDAKYYGNFSRFINHSCSPNLHPVKVFIDHHDLQFPRIAFFAKQDIAAEEELSFDYGLKFWLVKCKSFTCRCGLQDCRYSEETIQETLSTYRQVIGDGL